MPFSSSCGEGNDKGLCVIKVQDDELLAGLSEMPVK